MHEADPPSEIEAVFKKRGSDWTPSESNKALEWLYKHRGMRLRLLASKRLGRDATRDPQDALHDLIAKKWKIIVRNYDPAKGNANRQEEGFCIFWPYLITCFFNLLPPPRPPDPVPPTPRLPDTDWTDEELHRILERCLEWLAQKNPRRYEVFVLHEIDGCSHIDISRKLGITETYSRSLLMHARLCLQECLKAEGIQL